jgi:hypothetical protein
VRTEPVNIQGLAGPVVVTVNSFFGRRSIAVGGRPVEGTRRGSYTLPTAGGGTVEGKLRSTLLDPYPTIEIAGVKHRTGPSTSLALRVLGLLPLVLVAVGGLVGGAIGAVGVIVNLGIVRGSQPKAFKALLMIVVLVLAVVAWVIVAAAIRTAVAAS